MLSVADEGVHMRRDSVLLVAVLVVVAACGDEVNGPPEGPQVAVSVSASLSRFSADNPTTLSVTAVNQSRSPVSFGYGSGSCWLGFVAFHKGAETDLGSARPCTTDWTLRSLGLGESRTEEFYVDGVLRDQYPYGTIEPGVYEIRGVITEFSSDPLLVEYYDHSGP